MGKSEFVLRSTDSIQISFRTIAEGRRLFRTDSRGSTQKSGNRGAREILALSVSLAALPGVFYREILLHGRYLSQIS